jgi:predicted helicase
MSSFIKFLESFDKDPIKKGKQFEYFVKWFLENDPEWSTQVKQIWLWDKYPHRWGKDCGIDLIFKHTNGEIWAVQAKFYAPTTSITKANVDTFLSESSRHGIDKRLLIATTDLLSPNAKKVCEAPQAKPVIRYMLSHFLASTLEFPAKLEDLNKVKKKKPPKPRPHQIEAIANVIKHFKLSDRGQLIMACGTGKTYTTLWIKEKLSAQSTLVLLPSLGLLSQTMREWTASRKKHFEVLCVCSDQSVGKKEEDESIMSVGDLGFPVTSNVKEIQKFIKSDGARVIFSTYQSSPLIAEAQKNKNLPAFDLVIADEAHRCTGKLDSAFSTVLNNKLIRANKRLFTTATPRIYSTAVKTASEGRGVEIVGMDDESLFGKVFYSLSFGQAISRKPNLLTDYQVIIIGVDNPMIAKWIKDRELLALDPNNTMDAQTLASQIGLLKAINDYNLKRVISFHSRVNRAESFVNEIQKVSSWIPKKHRPSGKLIADFVSGVMPTDKRRQKLDRLKGLDSDERGILSNARCLSEGVDVPSLDGIAFIDPRASQIDIIQAVGRAIRLSNNKKIGTIVLPVFIEDGANAQASIEASNFKPIWAVLNALKAHDDVLSQELDQARTALGEQALTKNKTGGLSKIIVDLPASVDASFSNSLKTYLVEQVTESWNFWYGLLNRFAKKNGHTRIADRAKFENRNLGSWVSNQRHNQNKLTTKKINLLEALPKWSWDALRDRWDEGYICLEEFVAEFGHSNVSYHQKYKGFPLGSWVSHQRRKKDTLGSECL